MIKLKKRKKATPPPKREALTKEGQEANKEGEKELERERKLLDYYSYPLQVGYSFYNVRTHA